MKVNVKFDAGKATARFKQRLEELKRDQAWKVAAAQLAINKIQGETRMGNFIGDGSDQPALKPETIKSKEEFAKYNATGTSFNPKKSNITRSGQLLASLSRIEDATRVVIEPTGSRNPYKNKDGSFSSNTPTNSQLTSYLKAQGRKYLGYDEKLLKQIKKMLKEHIRRFLL